MSYIDREYLLDHVESEEWMDSDGEEHYHEYVPLSVVRNAPAADVREVKWISVKDRLPNDLERVLVFEDGQVTFGDVCHLYVDDQPIVEWHDYMWYPISPTHWMPLPPPPNCGAEMEAGD